MQTVYRAFIETLCNGCIVGRLPGHWFITHTDVCWAEPRQSSPRFAGGGLSHVLVLILVPLSQVTEHVPHSCHTDHPPSTKILIYVYTFTQVIYV